MKTFVSRSRWKAGWQTSAKTPFGKDHYFAAGSFASRCKAVRRSYDWSRRSSSYPCKLCERKATT